MTIKKIRDESRNRWKVPYAFSGRRGYIYIIEKEDGTYTVYCGASFTHFLPTWEAAIEQVRRYAGPGLL